MDIWQWGALPVLVLISWSVRFWLSRATRGSTPARDNSIRLSCKVGLVYGTRAPQLQQVLTEIERCLRAHPKIWSETVVVRFVAFGPSSLEIELVAWFLTTDWSDFQIIRQELFMEFMEIVDAAGTEFASPTQTVHLASVPKARSPNPQLN